MDGVKLRVSLSPTPWGRRISTDPGGVEEVVVDLVVDLLVVAEVVVEVEEGADVVFEAVVAEVVEVFDARVEVVEIVDEADSEEEVEETRDVWEGLVAVDDSEDPVEVETEGDAALVLVVVWSGRRTTSAANAPPRRTAVMQTTKATAAVRPATPADFGIRITVWPLAQTTVSFVYVESRTSVWLIPNQSSRTVA